MNAHYLILLIMLSILISCNKNNSISDTEAKYYTFLGEKAHDFYAEKKPQKQLKDPTLIYKQMQPLDAIDFSEWDNINYNTGDIITQTKNMSHIYDYTKNNSLTVINTEKWDAVIGLYKNTGSHFNGLLYGKFFLKSREQLQINNLTEGNYNLHAALGTQWKEKKEITKSYTQALKKRKNTRSTRIHSEFSKNKHTFQKDSITFTNNTKRIVTISNSYPKIPYPRPLDNNKVIYENHLGERLSVDEAFLFIKHNKNKNNIMKTIVVDGILECYVINME